MSNAVATTQDETPEIAGSSAIIKVIEAAASNPAVDVDKMERLLQMHERILERNAEQAFNEAMRAVQEELKPVVRDAQNDQTKSTYARLETINEAITPIITKHGFSTSFGTDDSPRENHYRVTCLVSHNAGHSRSYHADVPADMTGMKGTQNKTATHGFGSTMSYGRRYLKTMIFDVQLANEDKDGNQPGATITDEQKETLIGLIRETGADTAKFLEYIKAPSVDAIPANRFNQARNALEAKRRAGK